MEKNPQESLEALIQRELSKLPQRDAPSTLIPRVLDRIHARTRRHWWQCSWSYWPRQFKLLSLPLLFGSVAGSTLGIYLLWNFLTQRVTLEPILDRFESVSSVLDVLTSLGNAVMMLARAAGPQWLIAALLIPLGMYLTCVGLGTLCYRVASAQR
jgi:hypothetical protein